MIIEHPQFFTATILEWNHILRDDKLKDIIMSSLKFLVANNMVILNGFVIMPNHIHLIWQMGDGIHRSDVQRDFLKYTAQQIKFYIQQNNPELLEKFRVNVRDRNYQIWEHKPISVSLWSRKVLQQKLEYIHKNPTREKWGLSEAPEGYYYSSARFYYLNIDDWGIITHES
jgi:REP element-mobilizing transposase RayT